MVLFAGLLVIGLAAFTMALLANVRSAEYIALIECVIAINSLAFAVSFYKQRSLERDFRKYFPRAKTQADVAEVLAWQEDKVRRTRKAVNVFRVLSDGLPEAMRMRCQSDLMRLKNDAEAAEVRLQRMESLARHSPPLVLRSCVL